MPNRKYLLLFFCFLFIFPAFAQKRLSVFQLDNNNGLLYQRNTIAPFTGIATEEHPNGKKKMALSIKDGKPVGIAREWAQNGKKIYEVNHENGLKSGLETQWYATGTKKAEMNFNKGVADGIYTEWYKNKQKKSEGLFRNDLEEGKHQWWYNTGKKQQEAFYKNGLEEGIVRNWFENGQLRLENNYKNGSQSGTAKEWFATGVRKLEGHYNEGKEHGETKHWSKKNILVGIQEYDNGVLIKDINYRSGAINLGRAYLQVFNEKESFFSIAITGENVLPRNSTDIIYSVDGQFLQLLNRSVNSFYQEHQSKSASKEILLKAMKYEANYIRKETKFDIQLEHEFGTTDSGIPYLHWHFVSPSSISKEQKPRTVQHEHYLSLLCNKQVFSLYSVVTNSDDPVAIPAMLKRLAPSVKIAQERIDLNQIVAKIYGKNTVEIKN